MKQASILLRSVALAAVMALAVTGCADDGAGAATTAGETTTTAAVADTTTTAPAETTTSAPSEVTVTHTQGESTVPYQPETVVVFEYGALDTLDALGVEVAGVVKGNLPAHLSKYTGDEYENIGTLFEPDYELIDSLEPDLVIVGGRSSATYQEFVDAGIPTIDLSYDWVDPVTSIIANTTALGQIFGVEEEAGTLLMEISGNAAALAGQAAQSGDTALVVMTSAGEVTAYGPGSRFGIVHDVLGVTPAIEDVEEATHGEAISFEFILDADPDILYVIDRDAAIGQEGAAAEQVLDNELVRETKAWKNDRVIYVDPGAWYLSFGGVQSVAALIADVASAFE